MQIIMKLNNRTEFALNALQKMCLPAPHCAKIKKYMHT